MTYKEDGPCHLFVRFIEPIDFVRQNGFFNNTRMLSAQLRGELGYRDACHFLYVNNVPETSGLWTLNHDGRPSEEYLKEITRC